MSDPNPLAATLQEALAYHQDGKHAEAARLYETILSMDPLHGEAQHLFGLLLHQKGESLGGLARIRGALQQEPANPVYLYNSGVILQELGRDGEAADAYRQSLAANPGNASAWVNLGNLLADHGHFGEAIEAHRNAAKLEPGKPEHHQRIARDLRLSGEIEAALAVLGEILHQHREDESAWSAMLFTSQYQPGINRAELFRRHSGWASRFPAPAAPAKRKRTKAAALRVGFLSPDLGNHPVGIFLAPLLERLAKRKDLTTVCFNDRRKLDEYSQRNRAAAGEWHEVAGLADDELERKLRDSALDVLIDLCGHGDGNRLRVLARKPAPLQMTWAGYVGTTGLRAIDHLISDRFQTPDGCEGDYSESVLRLPHNYVPWEVPPYAPDPGPPPMLAKGHPTFGCFNNPTKLTSPTLALWARLLRRVPGSRLVLKYKGMQDPAVVQRVRGLLAVHGVAPDRVDFLGQSNHVQHLAAFAEIDVALDPMPYSGGISTCEAIWMGVPVVTLPGDTFASRHSLSHLSHAGVGDTIAKDEAEYLEIASSLVSDVESLAKRRASMRATIAASPLCDLDAFADDFVSALAGATGRKS
jgi:predicted O-linked N-acetylglucosamine transferase (SPINDLY family)